MNSFGRRLWTSRRQLLVLVSGAAWFLAVRPASAQVFTEPVVARVEMKLKSGTQSVDVIDKGDLLTVLRDEKDAYLVSTYNGKQGLVDKVNTLKLAESVEVYSELLRAAPEQSRLYTLRASAWWARGDEKRALADYDQAIEHGYKEPQAYSSRGLFHAALGHYEQAIADYTTAIKLDAQDDGPLINRAAAYLARRQAGSAIADYSQAIRLQPKKASHYLQRAAAYKAAAKLEAAADDFGRALQLDPKLVPGWLGRGYVYFQLGQHDKAVADFTAAIKLAPETPQAFNNRGYNRQLLGDWKGALEDYNEAIRLAPKFALAWQNKAWLLAAGDDPRLRDPQAAVAAATKACELDQYKDAGDVRALAAALSEAHQFDKAIGWQEKAIELSATADQPFEREVLEAYKGRTTFGKIKGGNR